MIGPDEQFWVLGGYFSHLCTQHIFDWDQRRWIGLQAEEDLIGKDQDAIESLKKVYSQESSEIVEIRLSNDGAVTSRSTDLEDDPSQFVHYPRFVPQGSELDEENVLRRSQLQEVDRLGRCVDLVEYPDSTAFKKAVFKYQLIPHHLDKVWTEAHILHGLQGRPSIVPFDKFVVDDRDLRLVGYTSAYIASKTLKDNPHRPFCLSWLEQLTQTVDDLNLKYGIYHQDIAPCNMMIDPQTNRLMLIDFDKAIQIGVGKEIANFDDINGVIFSIYEILTFDTKYQKIDYWDLNISEVEEMVEWPVKAELEHGLDIATIRQHLNAWVSRRRSTPKLKHYTEASEPVNIPPRPPQTPVPCMWCKNDDGSAKLDTHGWGMRSRALQAGEHVIRWERAPDPALSGPPNGHLHQQPNPIPSGEAALYSANLAHASTDCGCGYYNYRSEACGHLSIRYPFMCGATTDEMGTPAFCDASLDPRGGEVRNISVDASIVGKCRACSGKLGRIAPRNCVPSSAAVFGKREWDSHVGAR
jgi:serine/threonine protein kinase